MIKRKGIVASGGVGIGKAYLIREDDLFVPKKTIAYSEISREIYRFEEALIKTRRQISVIQEKISKEIGFDHGRIFEAHFLVLEDRVLIEDVIKQIKNNRVNVEYAFSQSIKKYIDTLLKLNDEYLRERVVDIKDIARRVIKAMLKEKSAKLMSLKNKSVIVAHDLTPSQAADIPKEKVIAFITDVGGRTSHTAIIARSLGIPAVVGLKNITKNIKEADNVIVDGFSGMVVVKPTKKTLSDYKKKINRYSKEIKAAKKPKIGKAITKDGKQIDVSANIELPEELGLVKKYGADGVGLYRTEYIFLGKREMPSEDQQYKAYLNVAQKSSPESVIIRTIDIGGDKFLSHSDVPQEMSPFLGWRAIRFCLARPSIFKAQVRAILRASAQGNVKMMFPMISGIEELLQAKKVVASCKRELRKEKKKFDENIKIGAMIEIPSAALTSDILAKECDFFSIGTNDLIQYSLAVDRANEKVAYLYQPAHPAVLRLIKNIVEGAHKANIWVGMCGEMSAEPALAFFLLGLGLDEFSMPPPQVLKIKELIQRVKFSDAEAAAAKAVNLSTIKEVEKYLKGRLKKILDKDFFNFLNV
jgi:phosphoenolpyruvate-protein phosphotransferase (PTS system enzyme I)